MTLVIAIGHSVFGDTVPDTDEWISRRYARRLDQWGSPQAALAAHIQYETFKMQRLQRLAALYTEQGQHDKAQQQLVFAGTLAAIIQQRQSLLQQYTSGAVPALRLGRCGRRQRGCCGSKRSYNTAAEGSSYIVMPASPVPYARTAMPVAYGTTVAQMPPPSYPAAMAGETIY